VRSGQSPTNLLMSTSVDGRILRSGFSRREGDRSGVHVRRRSFTYGVRYWNRRSGWRRPRGKLMAYTPLASAPACTTVGCPSRQACSAAGNWKSAPAARSSGNRRARTASRGAGRRAPDRYAG